MLCWAETIRRLDLFYSKCSGKLWEDFQQANNMKVLDRSLWLLCGKY